MTFAPAGARRELAPCGVHDHGPVLAAGGGDGKAGKGRRPGMRRRPLVCTKTTRHGGRKTSLRSVCGDRQGRRLPRKTGEGKVQFLGTTKLEGSVEEVRQKRRLERVE